MKTLSIDIETFSSENLTKCGVYRYAEAPDFEVLLFGYSADGAPVQVVDLTAGETLPADVRSALTNPAVTKWAFNAQFERVCLSRYLRGWPAKICVFHRRRRERAARGGAVAQRDGANVERLGAARRVRVSDAVFRRRIQ